MSTLRELLGAMKVRPSKAFSRPRRGNYPEPTPSRGQRVSLGGRSSTFATAEEILERMHNRTIDALRGDILALQKENARIWKALAEIREKVSDPTPPELDDFDRWIDSKESDRFAGHYVAFAPGRGPIAAAETRRALIDELKKQNAGKDVGIALVPCRE